MKKNIIISISLSFSLFCVTPLFAQDANQEPPPQQNSILETEQKVVKAVEIRGNKTIGIATILAKIKTRLVAIYILECANMEWGE